MPIRVHTLLKDNEDIELRGKKVAIFQDVLSPVDKKIRHILKPNL